MKKITIALATVFLVACNNNAENQPGDLDRTKNNDTSAIPIDTTHTIQRDSVDTTRLNQY